MRHSTIWIAACAFCGFTGMAQADCADELAQITGGADMSSSAAGTDAGDAEGISKDGSLAPLEAPAPDGAQADASSTASMPSGSKTDANDTSEGIAKDGSLAPLENTEAEPGTAVAMSGTDVQAQQEGEPTAAEEAGTAVSGPDRETLITEAQNAVDAGDEAACQAAVDQLATM